MATWARHALLAASLLLTLPLVAQTDHPIPHLEAARQLVRDLSEGALVNEYGTKPTFLKWDHPTKEARTVCATFVTRLFEHAYGFKNQEIRTWLGANGADAIDWHDAIANENGFRRLKSVHDIQPGDILAIKYSDGSKDTGHVMVVDQAPEQMKPEKPIVAGTEQYRVAVIDSSSTGHGPGDTRYKPGGGFTGGIGRGTIRIYSDQTGQISGYAWSLFPKSQFYQSPARDMVAGRLTRRPKS